jgi:hypothetical protein
LGAWLGRWGLGGTTLMVFIALLLLLLLSCACDGSASVWALAFTLVKALLGMVAMTRTPCCLFLLTLPTHDDPVHTYKCACIPTDLLILFPVGIVMSVR